MSPSVEPFDELKYKALMDGLECSEIMLSQTKLYEPFRIDSHFYEKKYRRLKAVLSAYSCLPIKDLVAKTIQTGHTPSMAVDSYYGGEIALIKTDNVHDNSISTSFSDYLTSEGNAVIARTSLASGDIITTIIGATENVIARSAMITEEYLPANINQNIVQIRIDPSKVSPEYVNTYLNTKYGKDYLVYLSRQTEQFNLNCKEIETVLIPLLSDQFQQKIACCVRKAQQLQTNSRSKYRTSENELRALINTVKIEKKNPILTIKQLSESYTKTQRLDAEYYQPKYDVYEDTIRAYQNGFTLVKFEFDPITEKCSLDEQEYPYVEIGDIDVNSGFASFNIMEADLLPANARKMTHEGDVIVSTVRPNRGAVAILENDNLLVSGAFTVLRQKSNYKKETLQVLLRTDMYRDWLLRYNVGTSYPVIKDEDILNMPIPLFDQTIQDDIESRVQESFALRRKSKELLEYAKQAVEMAIEQGEDLALTWLSDKVRV